MLILVSCNKEDGIPQFTLFAQVVPTPRTMHYEFMITNNHKDYLHINTFLIDDFKKNTINYDFTFREISVAGEIISPNRPIFGLLRETTIHGDIIVLTDFILLKKSL